MLIRLCWRLFVFAIQVLAAFAVLSILDRPAYVDVQRRRGAGF